MKKAVSHNHDDGNQSLTQNELKNIEDETEKVLSDRGTVVNVQGYVSSDLIFLAGLTRVFISMFGLNKKQRIIVLDR